MIIIQARPSLGSPGMYFSCLVFLLNSSAFPSEPFFRLSSFGIIHLADTQCLSQDLETGCLKLAVIKYLGIQIFKGDHNILIFQP